MKTAILVLAFNKIDLLKIFLSHNFKDDRNIFWCIVDNGSCQQERENLSSIAQKYEWEIINTDYLTEEILIRPNRNGIIIVNTTNQGYAVGNNIGITFLRKYVNPDYILISNNDIFWDKTFLTTITNMLEQRSDLSVLAPSVVTPNGKKQNPLKIPSLSTFFYQISFPFSFMLNRCKDYTTDMFKSKKQTEKLHILNRKETFSGSCFLIKMNDFEKVGFFDPNTFLGGEEAILMAKLISHNMVAAIIQTVEVTHLHSVTGKSIWGSIKYSDILFEGIWYYLRRYSNYNKATMYLLKLSHNYFNKIWLPIILFLKDQLSG